MSAITPNLLKVIIADQQEEKIMPRHYHRRVIEGKLLELTENKEIIVLTGIRRSGKSVLLDFIRQQAIESDYYFNFEDERLVAFSSDDFQMLYEVLIELFGEQSTFYFDEIQNIPKWELFIRRLYNAGNKIFISGSNANLFSEELGTRLTGRYISLCVFPFSFFEYATHEIEDLKSKKVFSTTLIGRIKNIFNVYCEFGGIPEYVKHHQIEYLHSLYESILYRDIIARYKIANIDALKKLVFFLASNCSKETTFNALKKYLGLGSVTTVSEYCSYLESSYLCFFLNRYSESLKSQQISPKKVYFIDHALAKTVGFRFSEDKGRLLENIVFIELKRRNHVIFYHRGTKECDFIIQKGVNIVAAIQVCQEIINEETRAREIGGLLEALASYSLTKGYILTESQESLEKIKLNEKTFEIHIIPIWKWLLSIEI